MMLLMLIKNDAACFTQFLMITNDDKNVANDDVEVENGGVHKNIVECDNVDNHKVKNNAVMSMMLKMMRNEGDRYETLSVGSGRKLVLILRK